MLQYVRISDVILVMLFFGPLCLTASYKVSDKTQLYVNKEGLVRDLIVSLN